MKKAKQIVQVPPRRPSGGPTLLRRTVYDIEVFDTSSIGVVKLQDRWHTAERLTGSDVWEVRVQS